MTGKVYKKNRNKIIKAESALREMQETHNTLLSDMEAMKGVNIFDIKHVDVTTFLTKGRIVDVEAQEQYLAVLSTKLAELRSGIDRLTTMKNDAQRNMRMRQKVDRDLAHIKKHDFYHLAG